MYLRHCLAAEEKSGKVWESRRTDCERSLCGQKVMELYGNLGLLCQ
jgi:hypothetical protein